MARTYKRRAPLAALPGSCVVARCALPGGRGDPRAEPVPITVEDVRITGGVAEARATRPRRRPATLFLRGEGGVWKLCDPERHGR
ncbi:hypothetical protein [Actinomadura kijaniata]|uniref:hypothetical protein n=1 Tax=Actinomadura kijaniata TaxID=46161 RepID=UPI00082DED86|nr:hypothetical protein [Actinomadura kijaniata]